jgi:hypothetical protein
VPEHEEHRKMRRQVAAAAAIGERSARRIVGSQMVPS